MEEIKEKIRVAVMGLPRKDAWAMAEMVGESEHFELVPVSLTDSKTLINSVTVGGVPIRLFTEKHRKSMLFGVSYDAIVYFMTPTALKRNFHFRKDEFLGPALDPSTICARILAKLNT